MHVPMQPSAVRTSSTESNATPLRTASIYHTPLNHTAPLSEVVALAILSPVGYSSKIDIIRYVDGPGAD